MKSDNLISSLNYGNLIFSERHKLDKKAYEKYYDENFENDPLTFNNWYGTKHHKKFLLPLLRKQKLKQIEKANH